jgi:hypothetical protein
MKNSYKQSSFKQGNKNNESGSNSDSSSSQYEEEEEKAEHFTFNNKEVVKKIYVDILAAKHDDPNSYVESSSQSLDQMDLEPKSLH